MLLAGSVPLDAVLARLSELQPVFHSEADFQQAFAWEVRTQDPTVRVRLETRPAPGMRLDVLLTSEDGRKRSAVELKYLTRLWAGDASRPRPLARPVPRDTALLKIAGLDAEQLTRRAVPPSSMSLIGVVRHLTEVEAYWLRVVLLDEHDVPDYYCTAVSKDGDFDDIDRATAAAEVAAYQTELITTRANATAWTDLGVPVSTPATSATWIFSAR